MFGARVIGAAQWLLVGTCLLGCAPAPNPDLAPTTSAAVSARQTAPVPSLSAGTGDAGAPEDAGPPPPPAPPAISAIDAEDIVFPLGVPRDIKVRCPKPAEPENKADRSKTDAHIRCLLGDFLAEDAKSRDLALAMFDRSGHVVGVIREQTMDGGFRGMLRLVPEPPVRHFVKHLGWVKFGMDEIDTFFTGLKAHVPATSGARYRHAALAFRFFRSVGRTTPSAYATGWEVAYNVSGSLHSSKEAVRDTLFHEIFHLNDADHGAWSSRTLQSLYDDLLARCGKKTACLTPYAPTKTMVRNGTYYAFHEEHVAEYAAELASRYFIEHRAILAGNKLSAPAFKCGPKENKRAWDLLVDAFFGVDLVPACPP